MLTCNAVSKSGREVHANVHGGLEFEGDFLMQGNSKTNYYDNLTRTALLKLMAEEIGRKTRISRKSAVGSMALPLPVIRIYPSMLPI